MRPSLFHLGKSTPQPIPDAWIVPIRFDGVARARFRLQHTIDRNGAPDDLLWADVSAVSDARQRPADSMNSDRTITGVLVDWIEGDVTVFYRRFKAAWLRVIPHDDDEEAVALCEGYSVNLESRT